MAIGAILGGIAGAVGNYFAQKSANKAASKEAKKARAHELNILQNQVGWRVQDATRAGLHPLAALGMNPASSGVGAAQTFGSNTDYAAMGADLGRAIDSAADPKDKVAAAAIQLGLEKSNLENEYTKTQIASQRMRNAQMAAPGIPGGQSNPEKMTLPGTNVTWDVNTPGIAQRGEDTYGEIGGEALGLAAAFNDYNRYMKFENILTASDHAHNAGAALRQLIIDDVNKGGYKSRHLSR